MVDRFEIVPDVCFEDICSTGVVLRDFSLELVKPFERGQRALTYTARVTVVDESRLEYWLEDVDERVVDDAVAEGADTDHSRFRIAEYEFAQW